MADTIAFSPPDVIVTSRLRLEGWGAFTAGTGSYPSLARFVCDVLTPAVTASLPPPWQGVYDDVRAREWIAELERDASVLLVQTQLAAEPIGLLILFAEPGDDDRVALRTGYLLAQPHWGQGYATELIAGLVTWSESTNIAAIRGGVAPANVGSRRVLERNGFCLEASTADAGELMYLREF